MLVPYKILNIYQCWKQPLLADRPTSPNFVEIQAAKLPSAVENSPCPAAWCMPSRPFYQRTWRWRIAFNMGGCTCCTRPCFWRNCQYIGTILWDDCIFIPTNLPWNIKYQANVGDMGPLGYRCVSTLAQYWMVTTFAKDTQLLLVKVYEGYMSIRLKV